MLVCIQEEGPTNPKSKQSQVLVVISSMHAMKALRCFLNALTNGVRRVTRVNSNSDDLMYPR